MRIFIFILVLILLNWARRVEEDFSSWNENNIQKQFDLIQIKVTDNKTPPTPTVIKPRTAWLLRRKKRWRMWLRSRVCPYGAGDPWRRRRTNRSRSHPPCLIKFLCVHKLSVCACVRAYVSVCVLVTFQEVITAGKVTYTPTTPVKTQNLKTYPLRDFHHG